MIDTKRVKSNVIFGDLNFEDYNAFAFGCNLFDRPERSVEVIQIPGRNGDLVLDNGKYNNIDRVYHVQVTGIRNIDALMSRLSSMVGYYRLEDEYEPDVYFTARLKKPPEILQIAGENAHLLITLDRYPQKWLKSSEKTPIDAVDLGQSSESNKHLFKFTIDNDIGENVYGRFHLVKGDSIWHLNMFQIDRNVTSAKDSELNTNSYCGRPDGRQIKYDAGMIFYVYTRQGTSVYVFGDNNWVDFDFETNIIEKMNFSDYANEHLMVNNVEPAKPFKPGRNYVYVFIYSAYITWSSYKPPQIYLRKFEL